MFFVHRSIKKTEVYKNTTLKCNQLPITNIKLSKITIQPLPSLVPLPFLSLRSSLSLIETTALQRLRNFFPTGFFGLKTGQDNYGEFQTNRLWLVHINIRPLHISHEYFPPHSHRQTLVSRQTRCKFPDLLARPLILNR